MKRILAMTLGSLLTLGGMFSAGVAFGETQYGARHHERYMEPGEHHGAAGRHQEHHAERYGAGGRHQEHHAAHHGAGSRHQEHHAKHHGGDEYRGCRDAHRGRDGHKGHHGAHGRSMGKGLFARDWRETLTPEQHAQLDQLRVDHAKAKAPLKAKVISIKTDLAVLATADEPDTAAMQQHMDEVLELKKKLMVQRYAHIAAVRKVLTQDQHASYDMMILKHASKRKRGGR